MWVALLNMQTIFVGAWDGHLCFGSRYSEQRADYTKIRVSLPKLTVKHLPNVG